MLILHATRSANFINLNYEDTSALSYLAALPYPATNIIQIGLKQTNKKKPIIATESSNKKRNPILEIVPDFQADLILYHSKSPKHFCNHHFFPE